MCIYIYIYIYVYLYNMCGWCFGLPTSGSSWSAPSGALGRPWGLSKGFRGALGASKVSKKIAHIAKNTQNFRKICEKCRKL